MREGGKKKHLTYFLEKLGDEINKQRKKTFFYLLIESFFFAMFSLSPEIIWFFFKSATIQWARWAEKKHMFFYNV